MQSRKRIPGHGIAGNALLAAIIVAIAQAGANAALAADGCAAVNSGVLNADVGASVPVARHPSSTSEL